MRPMEFSSGTRFGLSLPQKSWRLRLIRSGRRDPHDRRLGHDAAQLPHSHRDGSCAPRGLWASVRPVCGDQGAFVPESPQAVGTWESSPPEWLTVQDPTHTGASKLSRGETAAISLALELKADRALIDDRDGSRQATRSGLKVVGTLGILEEAAKRGLIDIEQTTKELKETNFRASERLYQTVLERVREQKLARESTEQKEEPSTPTSEGD